MEQKKKRMSNKTFSAIVFPLLAVLAVVVIVANVMLNQYASIISIFLNQAIFETVDETPANLRGKLDLEYVKSDYSQYDADGKLSGYDLAARDAHDAALCAEVEAEGIVLLKNEDQALPLQGKNISLFSVSSVNILYGGGGSGSVDASSCKTLKAAFEDAGFTVNGKLWDLYAANSKTYVRDKKNVNEMPVSQIPADVEASFADYGDAAVVVLTREGQEGIDLSTSERDEGGTMLQLSNQEKELLQYVNDRFDTVVVLLNSCNPMELGALNDYPHVKGCLLVGYFGSTGIDAVPAVLSGAVNPSGRLTDTFAYDSLSAPAVQNFKRSKMSNETYGKFEGNKASYVVYAEGIYVGYRYYETRYEDAVLGREKTGAFDYAAQVQYPFGYGLSYSGFEWSDFTAEEKENTFEFTVKVTNTGAVAGKDVVQLYMQSPYTDYDVANGIEKASVELVGFAKTQLIQPGASETVAISVPKEYRRAYDARGIGGYILEVGTYYFTAAQDAHQAVNNVLTEKAGLPADSLCVIPNTTAAKGSMVFANPVAQQDSAVYSATVNHDGSTGETIRNQFDSADLTAYDQEFKYLSRSDWEGTFPKPYANRKWAVSDELAALIASNPYQDDPSLKMPATDAHNGVSLLDLKGKSYDDPLWEQLLDNLEPDEMNQMVAMGGWQTLAISDIVKPYSKDIDGPAGISSTLGGNGDSGARCINMPAGTIEGCTWNAELMNRVGAAIGEDGLTSGYQGWYAPGAGIHRTPYGGRNFEYISEDGFLTGKICAAEVEGLQTKGMYAYMKHLVLNDQEVDRYGITEFANEQAMRHIYLLPFEIAVREADCRGMMAAFDCLGPYWCGLNKGLLTNVLRGEWGFKGVVVTDYASAYPKYMLIDAGIQAGCDLWLNTADGIYTMPDAATNPTKVHALRQASKNILYTLLETSAMNGVSQYTKVRMLTPPWKTWLYAADAVLGVLILGGMVLAVRRVRRNRDAA